MTAVLVNIGCGGTWHTDWANFDVRPAHPSIRVLDVRLGLPFKPGTVDACYSSHVLEHLGKEEASTFLAECARVLRPAGTLRVVVPDLEMIVREYLALLEELKEGHTERAPDYNWILLELFDQVVRESSGGEMGPLLARQDPRDRSYVASRVGGEGFSQRLTSNVPSRILRRIRRPLLRDILDALRLRTATLAARLIAGGRAARALKVGIFRASGEVHRCMYDSYSLGRALTAAGFTNVRVTSAHVSNIPEFSRYGLDVVAGEPRKPDSLYMEGSRP